MILAQQLGHKREAKRRLVSGTQDGKGLKVLGGVGRHNVWMTGHEQI